MEQKKNIMTYEGLKALDDELQHLRVVARKEIAEKIKEAREQGDLSENAEYDAALDEQRDIEARIEELEEILKHAEVVDTDEGEEGVIRIGSTVTLLDVEFDEEMTFRIVGASEASSADGKLSFESPVGKALIGRTAGDEVTIESPEGEIVYKILTVHPAG